MMTELFETVLILSVSGFGIIALLLLLKPITAKSFPAKWQYYVWVAVLFSMIVPVYKFIPQNEVQRLSFITEFQILPQETVPQAEISATEKINNPSAPDLTNVSTQNHINEIAAEKKSVFSYIWFIGMCIYIFAVIICYFTYLLRKRKGSFIISECPVFENTKKELGIKRKIRLKISCDNCSPMLVGLFRPTIYLPSKSISDETLRMIFLHELTHYRRRDLIIKWLSLFVCAVHWFNPLVYLLGSNISEACEFSCDTTVTHNMPDYEQKTYMKTILDLAG